MPKYGAFLRGVNLGARRKISSAELISLFDGLGFDEVGTFRTSGNVVFSSAREPAARIAGRIGRALADALGEEITVFLRTERELKAIAEGEPFGAGSGAPSKGKLQVILLAAKPTAAKRKQTLALATDEDVLAFGDRELYWLPSGGTQESTLNLNQIEKGIGPTTMRTMGTIEQLVAKFFDA